MSAPRLAARVGQRANINFDLTPKPEELFPRQSSSFPQAKAGSGSQTRLDQLRAQKLDWSFCFRSG